MQHPDEGLIHSWLDGALSADEAGRIESHVAECPQCRTAVAEARGFIAASSRILTALDDVPGGVLPAAAPRRGIPAFVWRAAAAVLVVAGGSLIVMRDGTDSQRASTEQAASATASRDAAVTKPAAVDGAAGQSADTGLSAPPEASAESESRPAPRSAVAFERRRASAGGDLRSDESAARNYAAENANASGTTVLQSTAGAAAMARGATTGSANVAGPIEPLRIVSAERRIGERRTIYEVAAGDTVTLTETESVRLEAAVVGAAPLADRAVAAATPPPPPPVADSMRKPDVPAGTMGAMTKSASPPRAVSSPSAQINTITWKDATTGRTLSLSGKLTIPRLEEVKLRIERERAGAGARAP